MIIILRYWDTEIISPSLLQSPKASVPPLRVQDIPIPASCADGVHHVPQIQSYSSLQPCCVWFRISKSCTVQQSNISKPRMKKIPKGATEWIKLKLPSSSLACFASRPPWPCHGHGTQPANLKATYLETEADSEPQSICTVEPEAWLTIW